MPKVKRALLAVIALSSLLSGCGLFVPEKDLFVDDTAHKPGLPSPEGDFENTIVSHIDCELEQGLYEAQKLPNFRWLDNWGVEVTLALTADELNQLNPSASVVQPIGTAASMQSFTFGFGASGTAHSTRLETIAYTLSTARLLADAKKQAASHNGLVDCSSDQHGVMIQSNLKVGQFIYDKLSIEPNQVTHGNPYWPPFNTFQDQITFVIAFGGSLNPVWKFTRVSVDPNSTLFSSTRTKTNALTITFGPYSPPTAKSPATLSASAENLHSAAVFGSATASSINSQSTMQH
jgi:hypothetical protein